MGKKILEFEHVESKTGKFKLQDIHFELPAGYIMGLMGKNGSGKTTLLNYILGQVTAYHGSIRIEGNEITKDSGYSRNKIGFVSEENQFFGTMSTYRNAEILACFYDDLDLSLFEEMMGKMEISLEAKYGNLSRGEKLKFQMAFAMAHHPVLYLLDEVTVGMDPVYRAEFFELLQEVIRDETASVLMTSHIESEMKRKTDYLGILEEGKLVAFGESLDIL